MDKATLEAAARVCRQQIEKELKRGRLQAQSILERCALAILSLADQAPVAPIEVNMPPLPALKKALTVVLLRDDGAEQADVCLAKIDRGGTFVITKQEMFFHQLRLRAEEKPSLLDKIDVFYFNDGKYKPCGLRFEDELSWPVGFMHDQWSTEIKINEIRKEKKGTP